MNTFIEGICIDDFSSANIMRCFNQVLVEIEREEELYLIGSAK